MDKRYSANLTWEPFLWYEMRIVADLLKQWLDKKDIKEKIINENTFQYKTTKSVAKRLSCIFRRLNSLDEYLLDRLSIWDIDDSKIISLYAIYKDSFLVYDFLNEFIKEKIGLRQLEIKDSDIMSFLNSKSREHVEMNEWTENTLKKIKQILKNILSWSGIIASKKIHQPVLSFSLKQHISDNLDNNFIISLWF